jgi:hypothetical protein
MISLAFIALIHCCVAGVLLAIDEKRTSLMRLALWLQIPVISSPIIVWIFSAGFSLNLTWIGKVLGVNFWLGSQYQFNLLQELPWGGGANLYAVLMLVLLRRLKTPLAKPIPNIATHIDTILQYRLLNTPFSGRGIHLLSYPDGSMSVVVGDAHYSSVDEVPYEDVKLQIRSAIEEWEKRTTLYEHGHNG